MHLPRLRQRMRLPRQSRPPSQPQSRPLLVQLKLSTGLVVESTTRAPHPALLARSARSTTPGYVVRRRIEAGINPDYSIRSASPARLVSNRPEPMPLSLRPRIMRSVVVPVSAV